MPEPTSPVISPPVVETVHPPEVAQTEKDGPDRTPGSFAARLRNYGTPLALVVLLVFVSLTTSQFASAGNLRNILLQIAPLLIVALGITIPMAAGDYDLSVGANASLAGILATTLLAEQVIGSVPLAIFAALLVGAVIGLVNGVLVAVVGLPSLIATLATMSLLTGLNQAYAEGVSVFSGIPTQFTDLGTRGILYIPNLVLVAGLAAGAAYLFLNRRPTGRHLYAVGSSYGVARLVGIRIAPTRIIAMVLSGVAAAAAGVLLATRLGAGIPNAGDSFLLSSLTVVFLGMTMYRIGRANVPGTVVGALFYGVLQNGLNIMGVDAAGQSLATGLVLIGAVSFAVFRSQRDN